MPTTQKKQSIIETPLKEMQVENELLLVQIHQLEEELEHYFIKNQELEKRNSAKSYGREVLEISWVDDELPDALAENKRLHALVEVLRKAHQIETQNALNVKLGNILIQGVDSPGTLLAVPGKLGKIWRESSRKSPPNALGGKGFDKVIAAYSDGGFEAVEKMMAGVSLAPAMQANAYTALARNVMNSDRAATAEAGRRAYELDPRPFRLKWLAFRLHEAGEVVEAEAMLDVLPTDTQFSESEARQASQLRNEAKHVRQHEAKQKTGFSERRTEAERQMLERQERIEQLTQAKAALEAERGREVEALKRAKKQEEKENEMLLQQLFQVREELENQCLKCQALEQEKSALASQKEKQSKLAADRQAQIEQLTQAKVALEAERGREVEALKQAKEQEEKENEMLLLQLFQVQEELESQYLKGQALEQEKLALAAQKNEQAKLAAERQAQVEQLTQAKAAVEAERCREVEALNQVQVRLEQEKTALAAQKNEQAKLAAERQVQVEQLTQAKAAVEAERCREVEALNQVQVRLEQEKTALAGQKDEQAKLAAERQVQVEQLTQAKATVEAERRREVEALKQAKEQNEEENEMLQLQLSQAQEELESQYLKCQTLEQAKAQLEQEKAALAGQKDEQAKLAAERQGQVEQLKHAHSAVEADRVREVEALKQVKARLEQEKSALAGQREEAKKLVAQLQSELQEAHQAASLSLKLQMLREADLKDLQARYQASQSKEDQQHKLLTKLGERLSTASAYFHQITNDETLRLSNENRQTQAISPTRKRIVKGKSQS